MKTFFAVGFEPTKDLWDRRTVAGTLLGQAHTMGRPLSSQEIDAYISKIQTYRRKLAQVRTWIASRIDADPMLSKTFSNPVVEKNFWDYMDLINKDQYYADQTWEALQNPVSADYDIPEENLSRTDEWAQVIDIVYGAMQEYGAARPGIAPKPGKPGAPTILTAPPAPEPKILGVPQTTFVVGTGIAAIAGILAYGLLK